MIFVDTGVWYARFVPDDPRQSLVTSWLAANGGVLVTSDYCVDETLTLIASRKRAGLALVAGRHLFRETIARLHFLNTDQIHRAWILFQQRAAAGWSFTDCTSRIVIQDLGLTSAATFDHHFRDFGIEIVP